ncbi:hypothetical protein BYT27DRAFT_7171332 [Phlegmacium glaucopus]|nr:hypothetical protein BYT27DRAFT_7171332 [Phlegmacium glaucopus]
MFVVARRSFSVTSIRRSVTLSLLPPPPTTPDPLVYAQHSRLNDLDDALKNNGSPSHVWANYTNLLNVVNNENIPIEIHQQVLRRCTPSSQELQIAMVRRLQANNIPTTPHIHEDRFKAIMRNIRILGVHPSLDDYHFILEQFAVVGHFLGSNHVYKELQRIGHKPNHKTFGLCFQSIAHRFTLPIPKSQRLMLPIQARDMFNKYMADMRDHDIPLTPVNLDMMLRILKETLDLEGFESLMRWGYGIDLSNPDRIALEYTTRADDKPSIPFPFTTTSLNTTIDMLGRLGNISNLVQAFEVLTQPLPKASQHSFNAFEEDDDFGVSVDVSPSARFQPPYACPNTTTYNMLLRHICRAGHSIIARHYILQAIDLDRQTDKRLRQAVCRWDKRLYEAIPQPLNQVPAPHFSINRQLLLSVMGEGNVDKDLGLLRWLYTKLPYIIRKKTNDLEHYTSLQKTYAEAAQSSVSTSKHSPPPTPTLPSPSTNSTTPDLFDLDLEDLTPPETPRIKYFNLDLHVRIITRNLFEIKDFARRLEFVLGRTTERVKERLGRRVWAGKNIYLSSEARRVNQTREAWKTIVNFQPRRDSYLHQRQDQRWGRPRKRSSFKESTID